MTFIHKDWRNLPDVSTPFSAEAIEDLEVRLATYAESLGAINVKVFGAVGDGVTDDTAAFNDALANLTTGFSVYSDALYGATLYVPPGKYVVGDVAVPGRYATIKGAGYATTLIVKVGASYGLRIEGRQRVHIANMRIDGQDRTARKGVLVQATSGNASEQISFARVQFTNCLVGTDIGPGSGTTQVDKNLFVSCWWSGCTTGVRVDSINAQEQTFIACDFYNGLPFANACGIDLVNGSINVIGSQFQTAGTIGVKFTGDTIEWARFEDVIFEGHDYDIYGAATKWPRDGLHAQNTIFQGGTANIQAQASNAIASFDGCRFNNSKTISWNADAGKITLKRVGFSAPTITGTYKPVVNEGRISVMEFGAKGDGAADDTTAITAALAVAAGASGNVLGATVFFPKGEYKITAQITVPYNVKLEGVGQGVFLDTYGASTIKSTYNGVSILVQANRYGWGLKNLTITGDRTLASQDLVQIGEGNNALPTSAGFLERLYISQAGRDCLIIDDALHTHCMEVYSHKAKRYNMRVEGQSNSLKFTKCMFREADQWGVYWRGGMGSFDECTFESNSRASGVSYGGVWADSSDPDPGAVVKIQFSDCHWENNQGVAGGGVPLKTSSSSAHIRIIDIAPFHSEANASQIGGPTYYTLVGGTLNSSGSTQLAFTSTQPCVLINPTGFPNPVVYSDTNGVVMTIGGSSRGPVISLPATAASGVPNNSLFRDSADNKLKWKDNSGASNALY